MRCRPGRICLALLALALNLLVPSPAVCDQTAAGPPSGAQSATPGPADAHVAKGYEALKDDRYTIAVDEFRAALALDPTLVLRARFPLAVALFEMHNNAEARRELEQVRKVAGDHPNVMYYLGRVDLEEHNFEQAIGHFGKAAAKPPFPDTAYYLGFAYFKHGNLALAEEWLKKAEVDTPHDSRVPYQLGFVYRQEGLQEDSRKAFAQAAQLRQRDADEVRIQSECAQKLQQGPREQARAVCDQLYDENDAERLTELGTLYGKHGDFEAALKPLRRAAELQPQSPQMQFNLAMVYFQLNRFEDARAPLATALQRWPDLFQLNVLYGAVLLKLGEELPAYRALQHAHELNSSDSGAVDLLYEAAIALGRKNQDGQRYSDSLHYYTKAAKLRPAEPAPHRGMAKVYALIGKPSRAKAEEESANRLARNLGAQP
ncbi:MAG TPA: tetratricopeptide repeat protein [Terriglobales bacterium]|nr:tetratricopeptide repeat protein [Terriglobales bacterium]